MKARLLLALSATLCLASSAFADEIDGDWCSADGKSVTIRGPAIRIPSGAEITGEYGRHAFRYVAPNGDPEEAQDIRMRIFSEDDMQVQRIIEGVEQPIEQWHRCMPVA